MNQVFNISSGEWQPGTGRILSVRVGQQHFGFAISNEQADHLLQLNWYMIDETGIIDLDDIYSRHAELRGVFERIVVCYDHPHSLLVPVMWNDEKSPAKMLEIMYGTNGSHTVLTEMITGWQLKNVYAVPAETQDWLIKHFPLASFRHNYSVGIRQIRNGETETNLLADFRNNEFTLIVSQASRLLLAQTFSYSTPADVLYHLLKVCRELSLSQNRMLLLLSGLVEKESNLYRELEQYFLNIQFREPAWQVTGSGEEVYPAHFFTSLNDLALCAS